MFTFSSTTRASAVAALLVFAASAEQRSLTILHFNDFHAAMAPDNSGRGGAVPLAGVIRRELHGCKSCLVLSAGDFVQGSPVSTIFHGMPVYEIANRLNVDASTLGNHEFDYGWQQTAKFIKAAKFPIVSADIVDGQGHLFARKPYVVLKRNGLRVGVLGIMTQDLKTLTTPQTRGPWHTATARETLSRYVPELRRKADVIVLLAHINTNEEDRILREYPEIPVVVSGHDHSGLREAKTYDGRTLVRVLSNGRELGRLDLKVDTVTKQVISAAWKRIPVDSKSAPAAPDVTSRVQKWEKKVTALVDTPIGESKRVFAGQDLKALIERATAEKMHTDFAFMNRGGVRAALPKGKLLARDVWNVYPFDNRVLVGKFKGKDLPRVVLNGKTVDPNREYTLAVNDFTVANQESPTQLGTKGLEFPTVGPLQRDLIIDWIKEKQVLE